MHYVLTRAAASRARTALRRLYRTEHENTLNDILGVRESLAELLFENGIAFGFDNGGEALDLSAVHLERYMQAAGRAIDAAVRKSPMPTTERSMHSLADGKNADPIGKHWMPRKEIVQRQTEGDCRSTLRVEFSDARLGEKGCKLMNLLSSIILFSPFVFALLACADVPKIDEAIAQTRLSGGFAVTIGCDLAVDRTILDAAPDWVLLSLTPDVESADRRRAALQPRLAPATAGRLVVQPLPGSIIPVYKRAAALLVVDADSLGDLAPPDCQTLTPSISDL